MHEVIHVHSHHIFFPCLNSHTLSPSLNGDQSSANGSFHDHDLICVCVCVERDCKKRTIPVYVRMYGRRENERSSMTGTSSWFSYLLCEHRRKIINFASESIWCMRRFSNIASNLPFRSVHIKKVHERGKMVKE